MDADRLLDDLDPDQRRAVTTESTLVAVIAGAGSGKTRVLTRRVAHRVTTGSADARHTLVLTFTREAAGELRRRLPALGLRERVEAGTFHSVLLGLLRQRWIDRDRPVPNVVHDRRRLLAEASGKRAADDLVAEIDWASARGLTPEQYASAARPAGRRPPGGIRATVEAFERYRAEKRRRAVIDLDDVLTLSIDALLHDEQFAETLAWRYRHLLVDEAQDLNPLQHRVIELLRRGSDDLYLVGDPAQAVYGFNGADPGLLVDVADRLPGIEIVRLPVNHRCTPQVLDAGAHVLATAGLTPTATRAERPDGVAARVVDCTDEADEAHTVARLVRDLDPGRIARGQVAVLARTHAQLAVLRAALDELGVTVRRRLDGAGSPYRDPLAAAFRLHSAARLRAWAHDVLEAGDDERSPEAAGTEAPEIARAVLDFLREHPLGDGAAFRTWVSTTDPFDARDETGVDVLTFHGAKGREWHTVVVTGVETGLVPHRSASTNAERAEEARLLYVALTRATDQLIVTWAARRGGYRRSRSPLLDGWAPAPGEVAPPPSELVAALPRRDTRDDQHDALVAWRARAATAAGILPDQVCPDASLRVIADDPPRTADELADRTGMGVLTAARLFPGMCDALSVATDDPDASGRGAGQPAGSARSTSTGA